jgi:hypothetical protein
VLLQFGLQPLQQGQAVSSTPRKPADGACTNAPHLHSSSSNRGSSRDATRGRCLSGSLGVACVVIASPRRVLVTHVLLVMVLDCSTCGGQANS